jgi:uncharacterized protein DUF882
MLRQRSSGVAKFSQHTLGKAMDFYMPGVPLEQIRAVGLYLQRGGVGFYPTSGSPFVHLDTGSVRHWPSIAADEMPHLMAEGQSLHNAAENTEVAANRRQPTVVAKLGARAAPDRDAATARPAPVVTLAAQLDRPSVVPLPQSKPARPQAATYEVASAESRPVQLRPAQTASLVARAPSANDIISQRDYWRNVPGMDLAAAPQPNPPQANADVPRPPAPIPTPVVVASADPEATASLGGNLAPWPLPERTDPRAAGALAYADTAAPVAAQPRAAPMGTARYHGRGQAHRRPALGHLQSAARTCRHHHCCRGRDQDRRSFQRSVAARPDRGPQRARVHERIKLRADRLSRPRTLHAQAAVDRDDDVLERSAARHDDPEVHRHGRRLRLHRDVRHPHRVPALDEPIGPQRRA